MARYSVRHLVIRLQDERPHTWLFTGNPVSGTEYTYAVSDRNLRKDYKWEFTVRVPNSKNEYIEVRPRVYPNLKVWAGLDRRSLNFRRAERRTHRAKYYCQIALADPTGERTKHIVKQSKRARLPRWLQDFKSDIRKKASVRQTAGRDQNELVILVNEKDHARMIAAFFALKVWVLKERFTTD